jgi:phosphonate transport system permease protein
MTQTNEDDAAHRASLRMKYPRLMRGDYAARMTAARATIAVLGLFAYALYRFEFSLSRLGEGVHRLFGFVLLMFPPSPGAQLNLFLKAMAETLAMAFLGTLIASALAFPIGLLAARNVLPSFLARFLIRRGMDTMRSIDTLIWALIWIYAVGPGPFAGILAIATTDIGALAKLFSEAIENAGRKAEEGVTASGGGALSRIRFGLLPEALPVMVSQVLYFIESNARSATIVGIVGAGGIGLYLTESIRSNDWDKVAFIVILILIAVATIDFISSRLRHAMTGTRAAHL